MRRLILWLIISTLLGVAAVAIAISYGQRQPYKSPLPSLGYDFCDGLPCYLGIVSGYTAWTEATERIAKQPMSMMNPSTTITNFSTASTSGFLLSESRDSVVVVFAVAPLDLQSEFPTLRDILLFYGTPCNVYTEQYQDKITLIRLNYPHLTVSFPRVTQRLSLERRAQEIRFTQLQADQCVPTRATKAWRGLTTYQRYLRP